MEFKFHHMFAFLFLSLVVISNAALPSEEYWNSVLPDSPMPKSLKDLLQPSEYVEEKSTAVGVTKGGVHVNTGKGTTVNVGHGNVGVNTGKGKPGGTNVNVGHGNVGVHTGKPGKRTNVGVGKGGVSVTSPKRKGKPVYVGLGPKLPFNYLYAATETQLHDNPNVALFFLEKDMHSGQTMNLHFSEGTNHATFLPRQVADSIPFSSKKLPEIFSEFNPSSDQAEVMKKTITECEDKGIKGDEKYCATSLESMIDFSTAELGKNVKAISTNAQEKGEKSSPKKYSIVGVTKMPSSDKRIVVCHRMEYAYAVFYCHKTEKTVSYEVLMVASDGSRADAVAVCHRDTAQWNPKHLAFQVLKVKPGSVPICHFLPEDHVVWVPKY